MRAVVIGATGAVGHHIVEALLSDKRWTRVVIIVRKEIQDFAGSVASDVLTQRVLPSLEDLASLQEELQGFDAMFCALGAYMKRDGPEMTKKVDLEYVLASADLAEKACIQSFSLLSAPEADASIPDGATGWQLYKRIKGLAIEGVLQKHIKSIIIYKPGILFGRFSAQGTASIRSKGNWDKVVSCISCCCSCLVSKIGVQCKHLGKVMVSVAASGGVEFIGADGGKITLTNAQIVQYQVVESPMPPEKVGASM